MHMTNVTFEMPEDEQEVDQNKLTIEKNRKKTEIEIRRVLQKIFQKTKSDLTEEDKGFMRARVSYLTETERETYADILTSSIDRPFNEWTRNELNEKALSLGVESPDKMGSKQEVIDAIEKLQSK